MRPRPEWIEVGRVSRAHGVQGESRVLLSSDNPDRFVAGEVLYGRPERRGVAGARLPAQVRLTIRSVRGDSEFPIVAFEEVGDRDAAEALRGYVLEVPGGDLPELDDDEFYPFDLIGLEADLLGDLACAREADRRMERPAPGHGSARGRA